MTDADDNTKTLNHRKMLQKTKKQQPSENQRILKPKYKQSGGPVFTFSLPRGRFAPLPPVSYATASRVAAFA